MKTRSRKNRRIQQRSDQIFPRLILDEKTTVRQKASSARINMNKEFLSTCGSNFGRLSSSKKKSKTSRRTQSNTFYSTFTSLNYNQEGRKSAIKKVNNFRLSSSRKRNSNSLSLFSSSLIPNYENKSQKLDNIYTILDTEEKKKKIEKKKKKKEEEEEIANIWLEEDDRIILHDQEKRELSLREKRYIRGCIDCRNKYLPLQIKIISSGSFKIYIGFNKHPRVENYEKMFFDEDVLIGTEYQKDLVKGYSIKFMLMPMFDIEMSVIPQFTGVKNRIFYKKMPKFKNIQYEKFKRLKLDFPKRIQMDKVYEKVKGNKRDLHLFNSRYKAIKIKHKVNDYNKRKKRVLRKKERLYNETNTRNRENLNRNQKLKEEKIVVFWNLLRKWMKSSKQNFWIKTIFFIRVVEKLSADYLEKKEKLLKRLVRNRRATMIAVMFKTKLSRRFKRHLQVDDIESAIYSLNIFSSLNLRRIDYKVEQTAGRFFKNMGQVLKLNQVIFEYKVGFERIRKRWQNHMACKKKSYREFKIGIEGAQMNFANLCNDIEDTEIQDVQYLAPFIVDELFHLIFNFQLLDHFKKRYEEKLKFNYDILSELDRISGSDSDYGYEKREKKLFYLEKLIKFENSRKALESNHFYKLYKLVNKNYRNRTYREFYKIKRKSNLLKARPKRLGTRGRKNKKSPSRRKSTFAKKKALIEKREKEKKTEKEKEILYNFSEEIKTRIKVASHMNEFKIKLERKYMIVLVVTMIKYYKVRPQEFKDINTIRMKKLIEMDLYFN